MKVYPFSLREHEAHGGLGLVFKGSRSYFDPAISGLQCAHDILEHPVTPHPDQYIDEYMALGGVIAGRLENYYSNRFGKTLDFRDIQSDIYSLTQSCMSENIDFCNKLCNISLRDKSVVQEIYKTVKSGLKDAVGEWTELKGKELEERLDEYDFQATQITGWICKGYSLFRRRFARLDLYTVSTHLFEKIELACNEAIKNEIYEGKLLVDFAKYRAEVFSDY